MKWLIPVCLILISCNSHQETLVNLTEEERLILVTRGEEAAQDLIKTLGGNLVQKMNDGGPLEALSFCNTNAMELTTSSALGKQPSRVFKRVSNRIRNLSNRPDQFEQLAINQFISSDGSMPIHYVQKTSRKDETVYRYYKPLMTNGLCLTCHGSVDDMDPEVLNSILSLYPHDEAVGYGLDEFRGLVRVELASLK